jgi:hypothetical protein
MLDDYDDYDDYDGYEDYDSSIADEINTAYATIDKLRAALEPFVRTGELIPLKVLDEQLVSPSDSLSVGVVRRAAQAYKDTE